MQFFPHECTVVHLLKVINSDYIFSRKFMCKVFEKKKSLQYNTYIQYIFQPMINNVYLTPPISL